MQVVYFFQEGRRARHEEFITMLGYIASIFVTLIFKCLKGPIPLPGWKTIQ